MKKRKALFNYLLILFVLVFGMLVVWFMVRMPFNITNTEEVVETTDSVQSEEIGYIDEIGNDFLIVVDVDKNEKRFAIDEESELWVRNPMTGEYDQVGINDLKLGSQTIVNGVVEDGNYIASSVKTELLTSVYGVVQSVSAGQIVIENTPDFIVTVGMDENVKYFKLGDDTEYSEGDIVIGSEIMVHSNEYFDENGKLDAKWIEIL